MTDYPKKGRTVTPDIIDVDLAATGGLLPPGQASGSQVESLAAGRKPADPPPPAKPDEKPAAPPTPPPTVCRHCNMASNVDPAEPTEADVYAFSQSVWRDARFTKTVKLFGDAAEVTFRTLTFDEEKAVESAVEAERLAGKIPDAFAAMIRTGELRLPLAIAHIRTGSHNMTREAPADPYAYDYAGEFARVSGGPLRHNAVARAVGQAYRDFFKLADALERRAADKSFWQAADRAGYSHASPPPATQG
jgi:hypothetical protein